eukprot:COSAG01_NODE_8380_length_2807_cov_3.481905_3_plen_389_part_00
MDIVNVPPVDIDPGAYHKGCTQRWSGTDAILAQLDSERTLNKKIELLVRVCAATKTYVNDTACGPTHLTDLILLAFPHRRRLDREVTNRDWLHYILVCLHVWTIIAVQITMALLILSESRNIDVTAIASYISEGKMAIPPGAKISSTINVTDDATTAAMTTSQFESVAKSNFGYSVDYEVVYSETGVCVTASGSLQGIRNILLGLVLLYAFIIKDLQETFFENWFHSGGHYWDISGTWGLFTSTICAHLSVNIIVAMSCGIRLVVGCCSFERALESAVGAFLILEVDDILLPFVVRAHGIDASYYDPIHIHDVDDNYQTNVWSILGVSGAARLVFARARGRNLNGEPNEQLLNIVSAALIILLPTLILLVPLVKTVTTAIQFLGIHRC